VILAGLAVVVAIDVAVRLWATPVACFRLGAEMERRRQERLARDP
jgi:hypothetical protein